MSKVKTVLIVLLLFLPAIGSAAVIHVPGDQPILINANQNSDYDLEENVITASDTGGGDFKTWHLILIIGIPLGIVILIALGLTLGRT